MSNKTLYTMLVGIIFVLVITIGLCIGMEIAEERNANLAKNNIAQDEVVEVSSPNVEVQPYEELTTVVVKYVDIYSECGHETVKLEQYDNTTADKIIKDVKANHSDYSLMENKSNILIFQKKYDCLCREHFLIKLDLENENQIVIYKVDEKGQFTLYETREVEVQYLRETLLTQLKDGMYADSMEALLMILEDIES